MEKVSREELERDQEEYCRLWDRFGKLMRPVLRLVFRYKGETLSITMDSSLPDGIRNALLFWIYSDPALIMHFGESMSSFSPYVFYRDGLMTINVASNVIWIFAGNLLGVALFKKREIK